MTTTIRIPATVTLTLCRSRDTQQLDIAWRCEVSARVTFTKATFNHPRDMQVEDLEIEGVTSAALSYTKAGGWWLHELDRGESEAVVDYLTANLGDREDWQDAITKAVLANVDQR